MEYLTGILILISDNLVHDYFDFIIDRLRDEV